MRCAARAKRTWMRTDGLAAHRGRSGSLLGAAEDDDPEVAAANLLARQARDAYRGGGSSRRSGRSQATSRWPSNAEALGPDESWSLFFADRRRLYAVLALLVLAALQLTLLFRSEIASRVPPLRPVVAALAAPFGLGVDARPKPGLAVDRIVRAPGDRPGGPPLAQRGVAQQGPACGALAGDGADPHGPVEHGRGQEGDPAERLPQPQCVARRAFRSQRMADPAEPRSRRPAVGWLFGRPLSTLEPRPLPDHPFAGSPVYPDYPDPTTTTSRKPDKMSRRVLISGSVAFDTIMVFDGHFKEHILPDRVHMLNVSFLTPRLKREAGGCAANIAYNLSLLGGEPAILAAVGEDGAALRARTCRTQHRRQPGEGAEGHVHAAGVHHHRSFRQPDHRLPPRRHGRSPPGRCRQAGPGSMGHRVAQRQAGDARPCAAVRGVESPVGLRSGPGAADVQRRRAEDARRCGHRVDGQRLRVQPDLREDRMDRSRTRRGGRGHDRDPRRRRLASLPAPARKARPSRRPRSARLSIPPAAAMPTAAGCFTASPRDGTGRRRPGSAA